MTQRRSRSRCAFGPGQMQGWKSRRWDGGNIPEGYGFWSKQAAEQFVTLYGHKIKHRKEAG